MSETKGKTKLTRQFIIAIAAVYASLILAVAITFNFLAENNFQKLREELHTLQSGYHSIRIKKIHSSIKKKKDISINDALKIIKKETKKRDILALVLFKKTEDENFFKVIKSISLEKGFEISIKKGSKVKTDTKINYLKSGLLDITVDNSSYSTAGYTWNHIFAPLTINSRRYVVQYLISNGDILASLYSQEKLNRNTGNIIIIISAILIIIVCVLSFLLIRNVSLLIQKLSDTIKRAADGDLSVSLNQNVNTELSTLAESFNSLIEEMKEQKEKPVDDETSIVFNEGVRLLKTKRLDEAASFFQTMTFLRPESFASFFNLGVIYARNKNYANALTYFEQARELNPEHDLSLKYIERVTRLLRDNEKLS